MWQKLEARFRVDKELFMLDQAAEMAKDPFRSRIKLARKELAGILDMAKTEAVAKAATVTKGSYAKIPADYKDKIVFEAYLDSLKTGIYLWSINHPFIYPMLHNGNFMTDSPVFSNMKVPNPMDQGALDQIYQARIEGVPKMGAYGISRKG